MFRDEERKEWREKTLIVVAIFLVVGGLVLMSLSQCTTDLDRKIAFIGSGAGITSIGIAFLGAWMGRKSDNKMKAIANLEFDEKGAMMEEYEAFFSNNFDKGKFERFRWDLEAIAHVAKWAAKDKRDRVSESVNRIAGTVSSSVTKDSLDRIKWLSSRIKG